MSKAVYGEGNWRPALEYPYGPVNVQVISGFEKGTVDVHWDDPSILNLAPAKYGGKTNEGWTIVGCNLYRSVDGDRGPYKRLNAHPISSLFHRDYTDNVFINRETITWEDGWHSKGDGNLGAFVLKTKFYPLVKKVGQAVVANTPTDVVLRIDGVVVPVDSVDGISGKVRLIDLPTYDIAREKKIPAVLPNKDSVVEISYYHNINVVKTDLDRKDKVWYRVTSVATSTETPSGLIETPLSYCQPVSLMEVESLDYIWREAIRRNNWILEQGGERVKLFLRKRGGVRCFCTYDEQLVNISKQPSNRCQSCFGTGFVGGYEGPYDLIVCPDDGQQVISQSERGRRREQTYDCWIGPTPSVSQRDFIVKQNGDRYSIGSVQRPSNRGNLLQQHFQVGYIDESDIRYEVPVTGVSELTYPQTRYTTDPDAAPFPVSTEYQAAPMISEKDNVPDEREQRGRTPVWENQNY